MERLALTRRQPLAMSQPKEREVSPYTITVLGTDGGTLGTCATPDESLLTLFRRWPGAVSGSGMIAAIEVTRPDRPAVRHDACFDLPCPACGEPVPLSAAPVWTCPADLPACSPFREPADPRITCELQDRTGTYSCCGEDYGFPCYDRMPLHEACYDAC